MVLIDKLWDDVGGGPQPENGLAQLRKVFVKPSKVEVGEGSGSGGKRSLSTSAEAASPMTPVTPTTPSPSGGRSKENVWRSVFHPGSNIATKGLGSALFDKPQPNSPTVYDWLYSGETRSKHR